MKASLKHDHVDCSMAKEAPVTTSIPGVPVAVSMHHKSSTHAWYVIQVPPGKERALCHTVQRVAGPEIVQECFTPQIATERKVRGAWEPTRSLLLPGYIIVVTSRPQDLYERLRLIDDFTKLLRYGETFSPLAEADCAWLAEFTQDDDRVVPMSMGVMEGDHVVVFRGPLKGREACITSINRRKSLAYIELDMCGRRITTRVGLGIVRSCR